MALLEKGYIFFPFSMGSLYVFGCSYWLNDILKTFFEVGLVLWNFHRIRMLATAKARLAFMQGLSKSLSWIIFARNMIDISNDGILSPDCKGHLSCFPMWIRIQPACLD